MFPSQSSRRERDASFPEPSFICLSKFLVHEGLRFPSGASMERGACLQSFSLQILQVPSKGSPPPGSPHRTPIERDAPFPEPCFNYQSST